MKKIFALSLILLFSAMAFSQTHIDQNGLKTSVTDAIGTTSTQALRFQVATIGYNSYHWQYGGLIIIELFSQMFTTGYEKYVVENGYDQGANNGVPVVRLVEFQGISRSAKVSIGTPSDLSTSFSGFVNRSLPIYVDVRFYGTYKVRITYLQDRVDPVTNLNQIKIATTPIGIAIPDFTVPAVLGNNVTSSGNLMITGEGTHYLQNGNLAIGTTDPKGYRLAVAGNMIAESLKVKLQGTWPDFVFSSNYQLPLLSETEKYIKDKGHLPGIPSEKEVKEAGIDLGTMDSKLLKKIEELTLHLIEMEKKNERQQRDIDELKASRSNH